MPRTISLAAYLVKLWNLEDREFEQLSNFSEQVDFLDVVHEFLSGLKKEKVDNEENQEVCSVRKLERSAAERQIYGVLETGQYGTESPIWDTETQQISYTKKKTEADMLPFYFLFDVPDGTDEGIVLFQRTGNFGIRSLFSGLMVPYVHKGFSDLRLNFLPTIDKEAFEKYSSGRIEAIRFIRYDIPSDLADIVSRGDKELEGYVEMVVHAKKGKNLPVNSRLRTFLKSGKKTSEFLALKETNFPYQNVKVTSRVGGTRRTLDVNDPKHLRSYHDITEQVTWDPRTGHPKFDSIHELALTLVDKLKASMYPTG